MPRRGIGRAVTAIVVLGLLGAACGGEQATTGEPAGEAEDQLYEGTFTVLESAEHGPELCSEVLDSLPPQCGGLPVVGWDWDEVEGEQVGGTTTWGSWHVTGTYGPDGFTPTAPPGPPQAGEASGPGTDFSPACAQPDGAEVADGERLWTEAQINGVLPAVPDLVAMWVTEGSGPFVLNYIVRPGSGPAATAAIRQAYAGPLCVVEQDLPTDAELAAVQAELTDPDAQAVLGAGMSWRDNRRGVVVAQVWVPEPDQVAYAQQRWGDQVELHGLLQPVSG